MWLFQQFATYFDEMVIQDQGIYNLFLIRPIQGKEALVDLSSDQELHQRIMQSSVGHFWLSVEFQEFTRDHGASSCHTFTLLTHASLGLMP